MSFALKRRLYEWLPPVLRVPARWLPIGVVAGRSYRATLRRGPRFERATLEENRAFQEEALGEILRFACDQVPAYRELRSTVERLRPFEALKAFPLIDKKTLQEDLTRYLPRDLERIPHETCSTGGTSGNQLKLLQESNAQAVELAFIHRVWRRVGYSGRSRKATFRGVPFPDLKEGVYWRPNPVYRELQFSPFHMSERTMGAYLEELERFSPDYIHGYPSAVSLLADYVLRHGISLDGLELGAVLLGSESLYPDQRVAIESAFGCRAFTWYGHSEKLILGAECEKTRVYHHFPDYGVLEILDEAGDPIEEEGRRGEIVGTGFWNRALPLIRYRTEDLASRCATRCECGRSFDRFDCVEGHRKNEYVIGHNGAKISPTALNMHGSMFDEVVRYQYVQDEPGRIELRLMVTERFCDEDAKHLQRAFDDKVGSELSVTQRVVDDIPLTPRGKLRRLVQNMKHV